MSGAGEGLDVRANRTAVKYGTGEQLARIAWALATPLFRFSPRPFFGWRRFLLRCFGATIGERVNVYPSVRIVMPWHLRVGRDSAIGEWALVYDLGEVEIGERVTVSHGAHLCAGTHDHRRADFPLVKSPIRVESDAWVCADAFVGPGVTVGRGAVVAARAVAVDDVAPWTIVAGSPARSIGARTMSDA